MNCHCSRHPERIKNIKNIGSREICYLYFFYIFDSLRTSTTTTMRTVCTSTAASMCIGIPAFGIDTQKLSYNGQADYWWLRSPTFNYGNDGACRVGSDGTGDDGFWPVTNSYGRKSYFNALRTSSTASTMHILWALMVALATLASVCFGGSGGIYFISRKVKFRSPNGYINHVACYVNYDGDVDVVGDGVTWDSCGRRLSGRLRRLCVVCIPGW